MTTEHLHHAGEDARLNHTESDRSARQLLGGFEVFLVVATFALIVTVLALMIVL